MAVKFYVRATDTFDNLVYFIYEYSEWKIVDKNLVPLALSNISSNAAEFYIELSKCDDRTSARLTIKEYGDYLKEIE